MFCNCGRPLETENDTKRGFCFGCHVKSVRLGFRHGKDNWQGPTIREQQRFYEDSQKFKDGKITKVPARAELI